MAAPAQNVELLISQCAANCVAAMKVRVATASNEEEIRAELTKWLDQFAASAGLNIISKHEYALAGGRIDSKYGAVLLEYKNPTNSKRIGGSLNTSGAKELVAQIESRFHAFHSAQGISSDRLFGVGTDGVEVVFATFSGGQFHWDGPHAFAEPALEKLFRAVVSVGAKGLSFEPRALEERFGAKSLIAQRAVAALYNAVTSSTSAKAATLFGQWQLMFGEVCGYDLAGGAKKLEPLARAFSISKAKPAPLLFSVHTYYAIFMKALAAEICASLSPLPLSLIQKLSGSTTSEHFRLAMTELEDGGVWAQIGIRNFLEGDLFSWYTDAWGDDVHQSLKALFDELSHFDPDTLSVVPEESRDLLKQLYEGLIPKQVRHALGEYYTPDWLASTMIDRSGFDGNPDKRVLDPSCGSGTFLVMVVGSMRSWFAENRFSCGYDESGLIQRLLTNVVGFDLNPLAVMAARVNLLLSVRDLLKFSSGVELPVYLCDSILTPSEHGTLFDGKLGDIKKLKTTVGSISIPSEVAQTQADLAKYCEILEQAVRGEYTASHFVDYIKTQGLATTKATEHKRLLKQLQTLHSTGRDGIWARIIKNAFMPVFLPKVDYVLGNPPWINWESLPADYRNDLKPLWQRYELFSLSGKAARYGGGKKDLSMLFVYVCMDKFLNEGGTLGFVITQSLFKTQGAGDGFRRFKFERHRKPARTYYLSPQGVDDLSGIQVFDGATNRTALAVLRKDTKKVSYPVPYRLWRGRSRIRQHLQRAEVEELTARIPLLAQPVLPTRATSPWLTVPARAVDPVKKLLGSRETYRGRAGCTTWMNGVYWVKSEPALSEGIRLVSNLFDIGKIKVPPVSLAVESGLLFPLLRGRDIRRWHARPSVEIILTQDPDTREPIPTAKMASAYPKTYHYLRQFEDKLRGRSGFKKFFLPKNKNAPFYALYNVGPYTVSQWKLVWSEVGNTVRAAVVGPCGSDKRPVVPDHSVIFVATETADEAYYLSGVLNSSYVQLAVRGYIVLHPSPHVLENLAIPRFSPSDQHHIRLARAARSAHRAVATGRSEIIAALEHKIDGLARQIFGLSDSEAAALESSLSELLSGIDDTDNGDSEEADEPAETATD